ncbi:AMP-binding protein, partial [Streptomyces sp. NPDC059409]|uniref:AMP-binding protein n=1 Tax=Streptomyces sp. NPDC059409 TaxID=3346824 RepID=UPI00367BC659
MSSLFPALSPAPTGAPGDRPALRFGERSLTYAELAAAAGGTAGGVGGAGRGGGWGPPAVGSAVAVVAALLAGVAAVPLNPKSGDKELAHILTDSAPSLVLAPPDAQLPPALGALERVDVDVRARGSVPEERADEGDPALVVYTSGTTGPPKGAVIPRRALATTLDALADAWQWTGDDVLVQGLPLFHVHGLVLGVLGPLRRGGSVRHLGRFSTEGAARELNDGATMLFGVPTMYHRIAETLPGDPELAKALAGARLLVSGSAALPVHDHERIAAATGRRVIERYGMTETLMNTSVRADGEPRAGTVGVPLPGVELRLVEEDGTPIAELDGESVGEIQVRGPNLFTEYLNRPDATAAAFTADGFFRTGDMAVRDPDGYV